MLVSILNQKTIKNKLTEGGPHSGKLVNIFKPAEPNTGVVFKRVDLVNN